VDTTIEAVVDHVKTFATRSKYLLKANVDVNLPLADRVGMIVLRSLPGYQGPEAPLKTYDGSIPLSSFVNLMLKQAHLDLCREHDVIRKHEVLEAELPAPGTEDFDVLSLMAERPQSDCMETQLIVDSFLSTLTPRELKRLGSSTVLRKAEQWGTERPQRPLKRCKCNGCVKHPASLSVVARMLSRHGATLSTYALGLKRRPVNHSTLESDFRSFALSYVSRRCLVARRHSPRSPLLQGGIPAEFWSAIMGLLAFKSCDIKPQGQTDRRLDRVMIYDDLPSRAKIISCVLAPPLVALVCWLFGPRLADPKSTIARERSWKELLHMRFSLSLC
jgi:hypothetical protein